MTHTPQDASPQPEPFISLRFASSVKEKEEGGKQRRASQTAHRIFERATENGWLPTRHVGWPVVLLPIFFGWMLGRDLPLMCTATVSSSSAAPPVEVSTPLHPQAIVAAAALSVAWVALFLAASALSTWLAAKRDPRCHRAIVFYSGIAAVGMGLTAALAPNVVYWLAVCGPLLLIAAGLALAGHARSFVAEASTVAVSMLMVPVISFVLSGRATGICDVWSTIFVTDVERVWTVTIGLGAYFIALIPYIRSVSTPASSKAALGASLLMHAAFLGWTVWGMANGYYTIVSVGVWLVLLGRAIYMPWKNSRQEKPMPLKDVSYLEFYYLLFVGLGLYQSVTCGCAQ